jgi:hypothetical protein
VLDLVMMPGLSCPGSYLRQYQTKLLRDVSLPPARRSGGRSSSFLAVLPWTVTTSKTGFPFRTFSFTDPCGLESYTGGAGGACKLSSRYIGSSVGYLTRVTRALHQMNIVEVVARQPVLATAIS